MRGEYWRQRNGCCIYQRYPSAARVWVSGNRDSVRAMDFIRMFSDTLDAVKQSAALCLLRLYRTSAEALQLNTEWTARIIHLLNDQHLVSEWTINRRQRMNSFDYVQGVATASVSLIDALVKRNPDEYKGCVTLAVSRLSRVMSPSFAISSSPSFYADCHFLLHWLSRLHLLFRSSTVALRQIVTFITELSSTR